jgi:hypothetical protein
MPRKRRFFGVAHTPKPKKKNKGIHSKNRHTTNKNGKYYTGTKNGCKRYRGQGR